MTVVDQPADLTEAEARRLTERIRLALDRVSTAWADLGERISEAYQRRADLALGYASWAEYAEAELKPAEGIALEVRRQLVGMLSAAGMSTRAIAPTVGVSQSTIRDDTQVSRNYSPEPEPSPAEESLDDYRKRVLEDAETNHKIVRLTGPNSVATPWPSKAAAPTFPATDVTGWDPQDVADMLAEDDTQVEQRETATKITGLDGKTYTRPEPAPTPAKKRRRALIDGFFDATYDLRKITDRLIRLADDDRFPQNANQVAAAHLGDLVLARDALNRVIEQMEGIQ